MSKGKNIAASVRQRLLNLARERREDFNFVLRQYGMQRLLYRLSVSEYADRFLLKGALLFWVWQEQFHRPTLDIDLLGFGSNDETHLQEVFERVCRLEVSDGLFFDVASINSTRIKEDAIYQGVRITLLGQLENARIPLQVDIGFGDAVTPDPEICQLPSFLDFPAVMLRMYPVYTVVAEKFQAMVALDLLNSRMKDYYDLWQIAVTMALEGELLSQAIRRTFVRRQTAIQTVPLHVFSQAFCENANKQMQWKAFLNKNRLPNDIHFALMMEQIQRFLAPVYQSVAEERAFAFRWEPSSCAWGM